MLDKTCSFGLGLLVVATTAHYCCPFGEWAAVLAGRGSTAAHYYCPFNV